VSPPVVTKSVGPSAGGGLSPLPQGEITLTGTAQEGVESGCVLLRTNQGLYLLIGGDRKTITGGGTLVVRGKVVPDLVTTCQQGTPFQVSDVRRS
jgi:hypothetical protein